MLKTSQFGDPGKRCDGLNENIVILKIFVNMYTDCNNNYSTKCIPCYCYFVMFLLLK